MATELAQILGVRMTLKDCKKEELFALFYKILSMIEMQYSIKMLCFMKPVIIQISWTKEAQRISVEPFQWGEVVAAKWAASGWDELQLVLGLFFWLHAKKPAQDIHIIWDSFKYGIYLWVEGVQ